MATVLLEDAGRRKLTQTVPHHVFGDKDWVKRFSIVNQKGMTYELVRKPESEDMRALRGVGRLENFTSNLSSGFEDKVSVNTHQYLCIMTNKHTSYNALLLIGYNYIHLFM